MISIIMLTNNRPSLFERALKSILAQNIKDYELIIVCDLKENAQTAKVLANIEDNYNIKVIDFKYKNISCGKNEALKYVEGEYITFFDDDDFCEEDYLETLLGLIEENNADIAFCGSKLSFEDGTTKDNFVFNKTLVFDKQEGIIALFDRKLLNLATPTKIFRKNIFTNISFDESFNYDDIGSTYLFFERANKIVAKGTPKYYFHRHTTNTSSFTENNNYSDEIFNEYIRAYDKRNIYLTERIPNLKDYLQYSKLSYFISMCEKIQTNNLYKCRKSYLYMYDEFEKSRDFFETVPYLTNRDKMLLTYNFDRDYFALIPTKYKIDDYNYWLKTLTENKVVFFGAGAGTSCLISDYETINIIPRYIVDNDKNKHGKRLNGYEIKSMEYLLDNDREAKIVILSGAYYEEIRKALIIKGFKKENICNTQMFCGYYDKKFLEFANENDSEFYEVYSFLADELSKFTLRNKLGFYECFDIDKLVEIKDDNCYFNKDIFGAKRLENVKCYVDIGAYTGDTIEEFIKINNNYKKIYAIEPDEKYYDKLFRFKSNKNIEFISDGCYSVNGLVDCKMDIVHNMFTFYPTEGTNVKMKVSKLDDMICEEVDFIKIDIEGADLEALKGAESIIKKYKPMIAVNIYHFMEHMHLIPRYLKSIVPEYKVFIRHHSYSHFDTTCYVYIEDKN